jgi:hypothetical protein
MPEPEIAIDSVMPFRKNGVLLWDVATPCAVTRAAKPRRGPPAPTSANAFAIDRQRRSSTSDDSDFLAQRKCSR